MDPIEADALPWDHLENGTMNVRRKQLGEAAGGEQLGCSLYEIPSGEATYPYHYHHANEEAIYVLAGEGTIRLPDGDRSITSGTYVALPADERGAHRVRNTGSAPLRYLVVSTMNDPDITRYPDSDKFGVYAGSPPGGRAERSLEGYYFTGDDVDYWAGEDAEQ